MTLTDHGGAGRPLMLLHGLMGRGAAWADHVPWLRAYGHVYAYDAPFHRGAAAAAGPADAETATEAFVAELVAVLEPLVATAGPAVLIGHSMGGLHAWCTAAARPDLVAGIVVEDMAYDFRGHTAGAWAAWVHTWPATLTAAAQFDELFGPVAGEYFRRSFERTPGGWRLHGDVETFRRIAEHWSTRSHLGQWRAGRCPVLLLEAEWTIAPAGQIAYMAAVAGERCTHRRIAGAGHLIHFDRPADYRAAVAAWFGASGLAG